MSEGSNEIPASGAEGVLGNPGWITGVTHHCGSKNGRPADSSEPSIYELAAIEICKAQPALGIGEAWFGGGQSGIMGLVAYTSLQSGVAVQGVSLPFFDAAQGSELPGVRRTIVAEGMRDRKSALRNNTQAAIVHAGGNGTFEELPEWVNSRNGIVKPAILVNVNGFYTGMEQFMARLVADGHEDSSLLSRTFFESSAGAVIDRLRGLNGSAPRSEREAEAKMDISPYVLERDNAVIVKPGPLKIIEVMMERNVAYDLSNISGVDLHDSSENNGRWDVTGKVLYLPDRTLKPIIFAGRDHFEGLAHQFETSRGAGFIAPGREQFVRFVDDLDAAESLAAELATQERITPDMIKAKHAEAHPEYSVLKTHGLSGQNGGASPAGPAATP